MNKLQKKVITASLVGIIVAALSIGCMHVSQDGSKTEFSNTGSFDGNVQVTVHYSSGKEVVLNDTGINKNVKASLIATSGKKKKWLSVMDAEATSTLSSGNYSYSVWNMLDWDYTTCWAEGEPRSEGLWEGFAYYFDGVTRIDGFRIYPGYQKSRRVYRTNIYPRGLSVSVGGYEFEVDLDDWVQDIENDGYYYWVDFTFNSPVYDDCMYATIIAVGTYGSDPDGDCCITEFHPFSY